MEAVQTRDMFRDLKHLGGGGGYGVCIKTYFIKSYNLLFLLVSLCFSLEFQFLKNWCRYEIHNFVPKF